MRGEEITMSVTEKQMGLVIKEARRSTGLTQQDVAQAVGVSVQDRKSVV